MAFTRESLRIDCRRVCAEVIAALQQQVRHRLRRRGAVVCVSGGIDSSVTAALCVRAFGPERVRALALPERDSSPESLAYAQLLCNHLALDLVVESIGAALEAQGCYARRDDAVRAAIPEYGDGWKMKLVLGHGLLETGRLNVFRVRAEGPDGVTREERVSLDSYLAIVAATNMKQRTRMVRAYYHAEALNYAHVGSHNRDEYVLGFMVRYGDIGVDCMPIGLLYKTQVYELAAHLGLPEVIRTQTPTSDTYSAQQSQEEFFFALPFSVLDPLLYAWEHDVPAPEAAMGLGLSAEGVERAYRDFESKVRSTQHMRELPLLVGSPPR